VINENEERFFASESLTGALTPELLEGTQPDRSGFSLSLGGFVYSLKTYSETPSRISMVFSCKEDMLLSALSLGTSELTLQCGKNTITRDLARYEASWDIIRIAPSSYKVTLSFEKNQTGIING
jgi:hypothetical protein